MGSIIDINENIQLIAGIYAGLVILAFWAAMVLWAYRDMRARSRDFLAQIFVAGLVAVLNIPGIFVYILLRPRETLSEAYERSLEEEALLQEIEEKPSCPGCSQRVQATWQACPHCHTRLKKPCVQCHNLLELSWNLCPYCAATQYEPDRDVVGASRHVERADPLDIPDKWLAPSQQSSPEYTSQDYPQYVDDEY